MARERNDEQQTLTFDRRGRACEGYEAHQSPSEDKTPGQSVPAQASVGATWKVALGIMLVAVGAAGFAVIFRSCLTLLTLRFGAARDIVTALRHAPSWVRVLLPALGALIAGFVGLSTVKATAGVGNVMEAVVLGGVHLSMRVTLLKSIASFTAIAAGGSLGREGPLIQFGGAIGNLVGDRLRLGPRKIRLLIAAGTAAGFAAAYNTPLAAVLFVLEVVTGVVVLEAIVPTLIATVIAVALTRLIIGNGPIYGERTFRLGSLWELVAFAGLGLVTSLGAQAFMQLLNIGERWFRQPWLKYPWRPALGGLLAGSVVMWLPDVAGNGYEPLNLLLDGRIGTQFVIYLLIGKIFATVASVSSGSPGGVFTPSLLIGGALGSVCASALSWAGITIVSPGGYALVGMAAAAAATTHAPLMAAVMVFELSGDYAIVLPLMLATAVATLVSRRLRPDSVYTAELRQRGIEWELTLGGRRILRTNRASSEDNHIAPLSGS